MATGRRKEIKKTDRKLNQSLINFLDDNDLFNNLELFKDGYHLIINQYIQQDIFRYLIDHDPIKYLTVEDITEPIFQELVLYLAQTTTLKCLQLRGNNLDFRLIFLAISCNRDLILDQLGIDGAEDSVEILKKRNPELEIKTFFDWREVYCSTYYQIQEGSYYLVNEYEAIDEVKEILSSITLLKDNSIRQMIDQYKSK